MADERWDDPVRVEREYRQGIEYKTSLGREGLYKQNKKNERFWAGDQWAGAQTGNDRPLLQHNVIRRIGDYKMAMVAGADVSVSYSADGVPYTEASRQSIAEERDRLAAGEDEELAALTESDRINLIMGAMSDYFRVTAERLKFDDKKSAVLRNAYIGGTGVLYTYWDERVRTGLYADEGRTAPITGDIRCEVLPIENVYFGDTAGRDVQEQPYILIAQRRSVEDIRREMRRAHRPAAEIESIAADADKEYEAGDRADKEPGEEKKAVCLTKLYREWNDDGTSYRILAVVTCGKATVRKAWDTRLRLYPLAVMRWEERQSCAYGDSEITNLVPNQIAINRANTAAAWAVMSLGMPKMIVDKDLVTNEVTNDPGEIIGVYGSGGSPSQAISYVTPPNFSPQFEQLISSLIANTLSQSGANDAALGNMRPDNMSAIIAVRDAATMPMQLLQNRFYSFVEDVARIWAEFWVTMYGKRQIRISDRRGDWYLPFDGAQYHDLLISTRVDVGAAGIWSESQTIATLDNLLGAKIIDPLQYLERLPRGIIPDQSGLVREYREAQERAAAQAAVRPEQQTEQQTAQPTQDEVLAALPEEYRQAYAAMTPEQQAQVLSQLG